MSSPIHEDSFEEFSAVKVTGGDDDVGEDVLAPKQGKTNNKKKRDGSTLRKAPQAPKRFKSSYICFFMAKQTEIKEELGDGATVTEISKRSAEMWRNLPAEERSHWDEVAAKDKQRYMVEKARYTGPWQVPWKRAKKDPSAPKRPMSAFLYFSQDRRRQIKDANPSLKNTEVSRLLGEMWRNAPDEERRPHIEREKKEREKYKVAIAAWREECEAKKDAYRKSQADQATFMGNSFNNEQPLPDPNAAPGGMYGGDPNMPMPQYPSPPPYPSPTNYGYPGGSYPYPYLGPGGPFQYPTNGRQPIVLGPNGMPHYQPPYSSDAGRDNNGGSPPMHAPIPQGQDGSVPHPSYDDPSQQLPPPPPAHYDYPPPDHVGHELIAE